MTHSDVTVSVICYTALEKCQNLMGQLLNEGSGAEFILTANGNPAVSRYFNHLQAAFHGKHKIAVIHNQMNQGFIGPSNLAFSLSETPYYVALNDDAIPPDGWLSMLKAPFTDPQMAVTGARGTCNTLDENFVGHRGNQLDYVEFSVAMVRREHIQGKLFSDYLRFAYGEDADLCLRLRERGLKIAQAEFVLTEHFRNTTSRAIPGIRHIMHQNFATLRKRWHYYLQHRKFDGQT